MADGARLALRAGDEASARVVAFLARAAQLAPLPVEGRCLLASTGTPQGPPLPNGQPRYVSCVSATEADVVCLLEPRDARRPSYRRGRGASRASARPLTEEQWLWEQLIRLSACIARETHSRGGVLLHSGLAVHPDLPAFGTRTDPGGFLLAGRSGVGKSTASRRLPPPWRALADDATLVVRDERGTYWAHPWPTWSRFFGDEAGDGSDTWDVQAAVPLRAIVVLEQGEEDRIEPLGPGHALALLVELARQTSTHYLRGRPLDEIAAFNLQRFDNLCALVRAIPAYLLHVSLDGAFWTEIERALGEG